MIDDEIRELEAKMQKVIELLRMRLATLRTARAKASMVEPVQVEAYGATMPLNQLANVSAPEKRLIVILPYDASTLKAIEKAIERAELGLVPYNDGRMIRVPLVPLTESQRRELTKQTRTNVEQAKVALRNLRRDAMDNLRRIEQERPLSEDDRRRELERMQALTDRFIREAEMLGSDKEAEICEV